MSDFDERSGIVACDTLWGRWYQTIEDVTVEVNVPEGTRGKECMCEIKPKHLKVVVKGKNIIEGDLPQLVQPDDSTWTLVDNKLLQLVLSKSDRTAGNCWRSLLAGQWEADPLTWDQMEKKMTLQRFQLEVENPGMDFAGANISGNYHGGGPPLPSH